MIGRAAGMPGLILILLPALPGCRRPEPPPAPTPTPSQTAESAVDRGRRIYLRGAGPGGRAITARVGDGPPLPGTLFACVQCHGADGRGRPEGGVSPSDLTWSNLARPGGGSRPDGRGHPPYTAALFGRAVTMGWDPAGQDLAAAMPRYQLAADDLADLTAYVRLQLGRDAAPGVSAAAVRVGYRGPAGAAAGVAAALDRAGAPFRRRPELVAIDREADLDGVFAVISAAPAGDPVLAAARSRGVPTVGVSPDASAPAGRGEFAVASGPGGQARALATYCVQSRLGAGAEVAIVGAPAAVAAIAALARRLDGVDGRRATVHELPASRSAGIDLARRLGTAGVAAVLFAGPADPDAVAAVLGALAARDRPGGPAILVPVGLAGPWLADPPAALAGRLLVGSPFPPRGPGSDGPRLAAGVLVEGLKLAGRDLDRDRFVAALEGLSLPTESAPPLTFGPGRRVGLRGARVYALAPDGRRFEPASPWIDPGPPADD